MKLILISNHYFSKVIVTSLVCIISIFRESSLQQVLNNAQMELDALRDEMQQSARQAKINESK